MHTECEDSNEPFLRAFTGEHELVFLTTQCEGPHATWVRCPGAEARLDYIACGMRTAEQASWCGIEGRIDPTVTSIEDHRLVRANFEVCPPQRVPSAVRKESATP